MINDIQNRFCYVPLSLAAKLELHHVTFASFSQL